MLVKLIIIFSIALQVDSVKNKTCTDYLRELANDQTHFVYCATVNSVPVTFCQSCKILYDNLMESYNIFTNETNNCTKIYFDKDRLNLVSSTEAALTSLWKKGYCDDCYNGNNTLDTFDVKNTTFYDCLGQHAIDPCNNCALQYLDLNNFYIQLDQYNNGQVCFDIQDSMNRTRYKWSKEYKCCRREFNMTLFTVALVVFISLPLLFYGGAYVVTKRQENNHGILDDEDPYPTMNTQQNLPAARISEFPQPSIVSSELSTQSKPDKAINKLDKEVDESSDEENLSKLK